MPSRPRAPRHCRAVILYFDLVSCILSLISTKGARAFVSLVGRHYATLRSGHLGMSLGFVCPRERAHVSRFCAGVFTRGGIARSSVIGGRHPIGLFVLCALELFERFAASLLGSLLPLYLNKRIDPPRGIATRWSGSASSTRRAAYFGHQPGSRGSISATGGHLDLPRY